jgi:hypothetical protein
MKIKGLDSVSPDQLKLHLGRGARFVLFQYCVSLVVVTFKRPSAIYFVKPGESVAAAGLGFTLISLVAGWWGIPWGPIYTIQSVWVNCRGGRDVTKEVVAALGARASAA